MPKISELVCEYADCNYAVFVWICGVFVSYVLNLNDFLSHVNWKETCFWSTIYQYCVWFSNFCGSYGHIYSSEA